METGTDNSIDGLCNEEWSFEKQLKKDRPHVEDFCRKYGAHLVKIGETDENLRTELMYYFDDDRGGYTIEGIKKSLSDAGE